MPSAEVPIAFAHSLPPVVGIGTSAGGLHALEQFFSAVPQKTGLVYVVVQHLNPDKKSFLVELLQRSCPIVVVQITDLCAVRPDHVYVAPPGYEVTILHGVLHLLQPSLAAGRHLPIDFFFRSLAADRGANASGVILSGMGSDGTLGLRALKEKGGGAFVQSPQTAEFDSMPRSAINAELADMIAPAHELAEKVRAYFSHPMLAVPPGSHAAQPSQALESALEKVLILVRAQTGHDFSLYKRSTVYRRIQRRMAIHQIEAVDHYLTHVRNNPQEAELLFKELLIGVTCFFRDPAVWEDMRNSVIPSLLAKEHQDTLLRAWVTACSTGEEAYTLAMVFTEALDALQPSTPFTLQIFATDLEMDAVSKARTGVYPENIEGDVSAERLGRFFTKVPGGYRINKDIRSMIVFAAQSIASDPPFGKLSILTCRNLLIYLEPELQRRLIPLFHQSLNPEGILVLGSAETVGQHVDLFKPLGDGTRIYQRCHTAGRVVISGFPFVPVGTHARLAAALNAPAKTSQTHQTLQAQADQILLRKFVPGAALVTCQGDIVYFSGRTGKYLEPAAGKANLNLVAMARPGLTQPLTELFNRTVQTQTNQLSEDVVYLIDGKVHRTRIHMEYLQEPPDLKGLLMVVFTELPRSLERKKKTRSPDTDADIRTRELVQQLAQSHHEHQLIEEKMHNSEMELKSTNEALQSANEELTTSREELHSINQELQTVNAELQAQVAALCVASDDLENLLNSTDVATLFLDLALNVRRYTPRALGVIKLIPSDAGRPITDLVSDLQYDDLAADAHEVLRTLIFKEKEVAASENRWFMVRTMPYRTQDNRIDGVVITFNDISVAKSLEASLRKPRGQC